MTFGLTIEKLLLIGLIAVMIIGPERLPAAAESLRRTIQQVRRMARTAQDRVREELGPEVADVDWQRLDPRQYDPRRIIREALLAEPETSPSAIAPAGTAPAAPVAPAPTGFAAPAEIPPAEPTPSDVTVTRADGGARPASALPLEDPPSPGLDSTSTPDDGEPAWEAARVRARPAASVGLHAPLPSVGDGSSR